MARRRGGIDHVARVEALERRAREIAEHYGVSLDEVRHASYEFHNGRHWTVKERWERLVDGAWLQEDWLPPQHSTQV